MILPLLGNDRSVSATVTPPTLAVSNNEDQTAAAVIGGSTGLADNAVWFSRFGGNYEESGPWTLGGTRSGNGTVTVSLPRSGTYLFQVVSDVSGLKAVSLPVLRYVSNGQEVPAVKLLSLVQARVVALQLEGIADSRVFTQTSLDDFYTRDAQEPCVIIGHIERPVYLGGTAAPTDRDAVVYPILVSPVAPANQRQDAAARDLWFGWSYRIKAALTQKGFDSGDADFDIVSSTLQPGPLVHPEWWKRNAFAAPDVFRFEVWQPRGIL